MEIRRYAGMEKMQELTNGGMEYESTKAWKYGGIEIWKHEGMEV